MAQNTFERPEARVGVSHIPRDTLPFVGSLDGDIDGIADDMDMDSDLFGGPVEARVSSVIDSPVIRANGAVALRGVNNGYAHPFGLDQHTWVPRETPVVHYPRY